MYNERNGIVQKAVKALKMLISNNYKFDVPDTCSNAIKDYQRKNSPAISFFEENCIMRNIEEVIPSSDKCTMTVIRKVFNAWCKDCFGKVPSSRNEFETDISSYLNSSINNIRKRTESGRYYIFTLNENAKKDYRHIFSSDNDDDKNDRNDKK